jgi:hypothetical protein
VPGGLVQHVFSPLARVNRFALTPSPWPRHRAKNALYYVAVLIMLRRSRLGVFPQAIDASTQHNVVTASAPGL